MASDGTKFVVRRLMESSGKSSTTLDGAFRVHLPPDCLGKGINIGDLCEISDVGYGIAWRATERLGNSPKDKPASMTAMSRAAFGIKEGSLITLSKTDAKILHADKVVLTDVTPSAYGTDNEDDQPKAKWRHRCACALNDCEAFAENVTFDVPSKKLRRSFSVEQIESSETRDNLSNLFYCDDSTEIIIADQKPVLNGSTTAEEISEPISEHRIGGLIEQIQALNMRMKRVLRETTRSKKINQGILIHGYEGTGKTLLLKQMESAQFRKVIHLQRATIDAGSSAKDHKSHIKSMFEQALAHQPSLILMDDIDELAPASGGLYTKTIATEIDKIAGSQVLVAAACRSMADVHPYIIQPGRLYGLIELPIPDQQARSQILNVLMDNREDENGEIAQEMSFRTHGFTGRDLAGLVEKAEIHTLNRYDEENNLSPKSNGSTAASERLLHDQVNSRRAGEGDDGQKLSDDGYEQKQFSAWKIADFELALQEMRPTALREIFFETPNIQWSDIGGSQSIKAKFDRIISWPLQYPELMKQARKRPEKGVLLYGPPGCSKTLTARAVATTYRQNFIAVKGAELISMYVGESERAVREIFRKARTAAPCVIFFDEIDSIASERENSGTKGLNVLTTLLNEMDGFDSLKGVLVLAATNKPEALDTAIMRPGRFDKHIYLGLPNEVARKEIFDIHMKGLSVEGDLDVDSLVKQTAGYTGAEVVQICEEAINQAVERTVTSSATSLLPLRRLDFDISLDQTVKTVTAEVLAAYAAFSNSRV